MKSLALIVPLLVLTACSGGGGGGDDAATKKAYLVKAEAVCSQANAAQKAVTSPTSAAEFAPYVAKLVAVAQGATNGLVALTAPNKDKAELQSKVLDPLQAQVRDAERFSADLDAATKSNDQAAVIRLASNPPTKTRADLAFMRSYGFTACVAAADTAK